MSWKTPRFFPTTRSRPDRGSYIDEREEFLIHRALSSASLCEYWPCRRHMMLMWSIADVGWVLYQRVTASPVGLLNVNDILASFETFMIPLIAIEIFQNPEYCPKYLRDDLLHVKLVLATALMAIAQKAIVLGYKELEPEYIRATAAIILALRSGIDWWRRNSSKSLDQPDANPLEPAQKSSAASICRSFSSTLLRRTPS